VPPKTDPQCSDAELNLRAAVNWTPREPSIREQVLDEAKKYISQDRTNVYGSAEDNFSTIADFWTTYLWRRGLVDPLQELAPYDVAMLCGLIKVARIANSPHHHDSYVDLAGYAACGAEVASLAAEENR
jgi:hypothetical protein